ncbi:hypothetical protein B9Z55_019110 [Caenorhabditis nigoni]|nr:hypothetical protein B9Z55_019110 [Caenorhabditis nigoni]
MADVQFDIGDSCVCLHTGNNPYEAKVIDKKEFQGKHCYIVHFKGWNSRYDQKIPVGEESGKMFKCTLEQYQNDHQGEPSEPKAKKRGAKAVAEDAQPETSSKPAKKAAKIVAPETATRAAAEDAQPESSSKPAKKTVKIVAPEIAAEQVNGEQHQNDHQGEPSEPKAKKRGAKAVAEDAQSETGLKPAKKAAKIVASETATEAAAEGAQPENSSKTTKKAAKTMAPEVAAEQVNEGASSASRSSKRKPAVETTSKPDSKALFEIGEDCVCIHDNDAYEAKVLDIKELQGTKKYIVHFKGWNNRYDQKIPVGEESGKMFKETLEEYKKKYGDLHGEGPSEPAPKKKTPKKVSAPKTAPVPQQQVDPIDNMTNFTIVAVTPAHADHLIGMIHELAEFEKMKTSVVNTAEKLRKDIKNKSVHGFIAFDGEEPAGMNLYYYAYSTWVGQYIHMEDLYIRPQFRRKGLARTLWKKLAQVAKDKEIVRLEWAVLDWNKDAIALYDTVDYANMTEKEGWLTFRMDGAAIQKFADE